MGGKSKICLKNVAKLKPVIKLGQMRLSRQVKTRMCREGRAADKAENRNYTVTVFCLFIACRK